MKVLKAFLAIMMVSIALLAGSVSAKQPTPGEPIGGGPGDIVTPQGYFDPNFLYLEQGSNSIKDNGNRTITIGVSTWATQTVQVIGATIFFDRWNGSSWVELNAVPLYQNNLKYFYADATFTATSGYYYRARTVHWVSHNGVYEQGVRVTPAILCS